ncbi:MAG: aldo/keto reductase [Chitinophagaceae bacterium]|nr:aldo/keto reductase [Chitinophagaceae bacterium]
MQYRKFIPGSPKVSAIGVGAWQLGVNSGWQNISEQEAVYLIQEAMDNGINFFDTAPNYGRGTSEERLGLALKKTVRSQIVINTKFGHTAMGTTDYSADSIRTSLEGSLQRLQTDYVDSLIIHSPPSALLNGHQQPHYEILERLKEEGLIRAYGASLDTYADMKLLMDTTGAQVIEAFFNILHQDAAKAFAMAKAKGVGIIVKIPLDSGWLSGKYDANSTFTGVRSRWSKADIAERAQLVAQLQALIGPGVPLSQMAIEFCLAYDAVATVIPGSLSTAQLKQNIESIHTPLPENLLQQLEQFYQEEVAPLQLPW